MPLVFEYLTVFAAGALGYGAIEIMFRRHTHWTMLIAGGISFVLIYLIAVKGKESSVKKWIMGAAVITTVEFISGAIVNITLGWNVWDYSHLALNYMGQICVLFSLFWFLLCIPAMAFGKFLKRKFF